MYPIKIKPPLWLSPGKVKAKDSRRAFTQTQKNEALVSQKNKCAKCHRTLDPTATRFHHKVSWASGGRTITKNEVALCSICHDKVTHEQRLKQVDKKRKHAQKSPAERAFGF